ncbi:hypothetical protein RU639_009447 [Aspergillus parasiticus]
MENSILEVLNRLQEESKAHFEKFYDIANCLQNESMSRFNNIKEMMDQRLDAIDQRFQAIGKRLDTVRQPQPNTQVNY